MISKCAQAAIVGRIERDDLPLCVTLLESAIFCAQWGQDAALPVPILQNIARLYGKTETESVCADFTSLGLLTDAIALAPEYAAFAVHLLTQLVGGMELRIGEKRETVGAFQTSMMDYLQTNAEGMWAEKTNQLGYCVQWNDKRYLIQLAFSPVWLPVAADYATRANTFCAFIGPFAAQQWESLYPYYEYPDFRDHTACFDPWSQRKMNISKGGLFTYCDWFFRDVYGQRFMIEDDFKKTLHDTGLLRYDDEG